MKKRLMRCVLPFLLTFSFCFSFFVVPVSASFSDALSVIGESFWADITLKKWSDALDAFFNGRASDDHGPYWASAYWAAANYVLVTESSLDTLATTYNTQYASDYKYTLTKSFLGDTGYYGLRILGSSSDSFSLCWLADNSGRVILAEPDDETDGGQWLADRYRTTVRHMLSRERLTNLATEVGGKVVMLGNYYYVYSNDLYQFYADSSGNAFAAFVNDSQWAVNQDRPDTTIKDINGDVIQIQGDLSDNSTNIDLSGMTITLPDGKVLIADNILYDESTKTYNIDSHDVTNNYITYNYSWTYHINYTSITYIGQTEEYNKYYEVYYELPDGRDSADLTKEEVEQLNVSIDVIPYGRSADDTSLRSLYHFDGDTKDSSYWNYCTDFTWNTGASLTYMDAGVFNGALYLDEQEHDFTLTLPSILSGDFTLQFRYYQSYTAAPQTDSYLSFGVDQLCKFDGSNFKDGSGNVLSSVPTGSWNEIALIKSGASLYYYLNGLCVGNVSCTSIFPNVVTFHFGSKQQTYKYLDELRVLNYALQVDGQNYECTSVPYDTNLSLVLPDSVTPVADEYFVETPSPDRLGFFDFTTCSSITNNNPFGSRFTSNEDYGYSLSYFLSSRGLFLSSVVTSTTDSTYQKRGFSMSAVSAFRNNAGIPGNGTYLFVFYDLDHNASVYKTTISSNSFTSLTLLSGDSVGLYYHSNSGYLYLHGIDNSTIVLSGFEILRYSSDYQLSTWEPVSSVIPLDSDSLNTPTLAVRTDLDITSYQIGGVRPSLPKKGQVWALVENERITSIQIYNGSAWEACDGRIWTGERWVPASSYNIITLQDMYDIADATQNYEYIYTESGFWSWWQKAWIAFTDKLFSILGSGSGGSGGSSAPSSVKQALANALSALIESLFAVITTVLQSLLGLVTDMLTFFFNFLTETVLGGISNFFSIFTDGSLTEWFQQTGEDGSITTGLPSEIITAFSFISGVIMLLPSELRSILFFGIALMLLLAVFKLVKE